MKKTKMMVVTAGIVFGAGSSVQAKLPANSIIVGSNVYSAGYLSNPNNLAMVNDQLMNSLGLIYFVDDSGKQRCIYWICSRRYPISSKSWKYFNLLYCSRYNAKR